jgi:hypothetical protein
MIEQITVKELDNSINEDIIPTPQSVALVVNKINLVICAVNKIQKLVEPIIKKFEELEEREKFEKRDEEDNLDLTTAEIILELDELLNDYRDHIIDLERLNKFPLKDRHDARLFAQMKIAIEDDKQGIKNFVRKCLGELRG